MPLKLRGSVKAIGDGDTLRVDCSGIVFTVRLAFVDAPELRQPNWGILTRDRLRALLPLGYKVRLDAWDIDRYGRLVAEVYKGGSSIGLRLVREGYAFVYHDYLRPEVSDRYLMAESKARSSLRRIWSPGLAAMPPWEFRQSQIEQG